MRCVEGDASPHLQYPNLQYACIVTFAFSMLVLSPLPSVCLYCHLCLQYACIVTFAFSMLVFSPLPSVCLYFHLCLQYACIVTFAFSMLVLSPLPSVCLYFHLNIFMLHVHLPITHTPHRGSHVESIVAQMKVALDEEKSENVRKVEMLSKVSRPMRVHHRKQHCTCTRVCVYGRRFCNILRSDIGYEISIPTGIEIFFKKYLHKVQMGYLHFGMSTCTLVDTCMVVHVFFKL